MKGYALLLAFTALLLLVIPLPALSQEKPVATTTSKTTATTQITTQPTEPPQAEETAVFRILCDDKVVTLAHREFLIRTLAMEMPASYHEEALKAQAVAANTYYTRRRNLQKANADPALKGADFVTPVAGFPEEYTQEKLKERWGDQYDTYYQKIAAAVDATWGETVTYQGKLIDACFHAVSNGTTEDAREVWGAAVPYLQAVASAGDRTASGYASTGTFTQQEVQEILKKEEPKLKLSKNPTEWFGAATLTEAGTVRSQKVGDGALAGTRIRQLFGLRSAAFVVTYADGVFTFSVTGYGHGVGMSQHGAHYLAKEGYTYREILQHYYTGVEIESDKDPE